VEESRAAAQAEGLVEGEQVGVKKTETRMKAEMAEQQEAMIFEVDR
jgi:hypothetical protein